MVFTCLIYMTLFAPDRIDQKSMLIIANPRRVCRVIRRVCMYWIRHCCTEKVNMQYEFINLYHSRLQ